MLASRAWTMVEPLAIPSCFAVKDREDGAPMCGEQFPGAALRFRTAWPKRYAIPSSDRHVAEYQAWLNMVERFCRDITTERLRRGVFTSVPELVAAIDEYVVHHNTNPKPFIWTKSARDILQKVIRANLRLSSKQNGTLH